MLTLIYSTFWERARKILKVGFGGFFGVFNLFQDSKLPQHVFVFRICFNMKQSEGFKICNKKKLPVIIRQFLSDIHVYYIPHAYRRFIVYTYGILFRLKLLTACVSVPMFPKQFIFIIV